MYEKFNILCEMPRLKFYLDRDGLDAANRAAKKIIKVYLATCKSYRKKHGVKAGNKHPYRYAYLESAYSARYILRNKLLECATIPSNL